MQKGFGVSLVMKCAFALCICYITPGYTQYKAPPAYQQDYQKSATGNIQHLQLPTASPKPAKSSTYQNLTLWNKDTGEQIRTYQTLGKQEIAIDEKVKLYEYDSMQTYDWLVRAGGGFPIETELFIEAEKGISLSSSLMMKLSILHYNETFYGLYEPRQSRSITYRDNNGNEYTYNIYTNHYAMVLHPQVSMVYKYYFDIKRRIRKKKNTNHRNGLYIALEPYVLLPKIFGLYDKERLYYLQPQYGLFTYLGGAYTFGHWGLGFATGVRIFANDLCTLTEEYTRQKEPFFRLPIKLCGRVFAFVIYTRSVHYSSLAFERKEKAIHATPHVFY